MSHNRRYRGYEWERFGRETSTLIPQIFKKRLTIIALALVVVAVFALVDTPATVRTKSLIINMLPLDAQSKIDAVMNLCQAAYAGGTFGSSSVCYSVNYSKAASEEVDRRRDDARLQQACDVFMKRITGGDLKADWNDVVRGTIGTTLFPIIRQDEMLPGEKPADAFKRLKDREIHVYVYVGSDPNLVAGLSILTPA
jgi:hypothetical protein